jgi:hypothetical protein
MRGKRLAITIFVYLAFVAWLTGIVFLVGYHVRHPVPENPNAQHNEHQSERVVGVNFSNAAPDNGQRNDNQSYASKVFEPMTLLTFLLVVGVGITAYIYWRQLKKMEETVALVGKQGKTMQMQLAAMEWHAQIFEIQAGLFDKQVKAMQGQLKAMEKAAETSYATQCAHMGIRELDIGGGLMVGKFQFLRITWQNAGKTPAWNFRCKANLVLSKDEPKPTLHYGDDDYSDISGSFWPADATRTINYEGAQVEMTRELAGELWEGQERRLWVIVRAVYRDISGEIRWFYNAALWMVNPFRPLEGHFVETFQYLEHVSEREKAEAERQNPD